MPIGHVFISYRHEDSAKAARLRSALEAAGIRVWRDTAGLWPGDDWRLVIRQAIADGALVFLACFSARSMVREKSWQNDELTLAVDQMRLGANVSALLRVLTHDNPAICSWLPLSHDMGLVGALLTGWAMGGTQYAGRAEIILMRPEVFLLSPSQWLRTCGEFGATAAPTFALRTAARRPPAPGTDLSALRIFVVGAEPVDAA